MMTEDEARIHMRRVVKRTGCTNAEFARRHKICPSDLASSMTGSRKITPGVALACGLRRVVRYVRMDDKAS